MWDVEDYERAAAEAVAAVARYVAASQAGEGPAVSAPPPADLVRELDLRRLIREGGLDAESFGPWLEAMLERTARLHHPGELAHQVAAPDLPAAVADLVHGAINQPMSIYEMGAAANAMEGAVVEWMVERVGWGPGAGGVLTHGGSLANLTALLAARAAAAPSAWGDGVDGGLAVLAPPSAHYSVKRSVAMLGLGERAVVPLEVDELERIVPGRLGEAVERAEAVGLRPMALVAAAGATARACTTTWRRSAASAASAGSGSTSTPRTGRRRCSRPPTARSCGGSSRRTRSSGTPTRCCARRPSARRSWCATCPASTPPSSRAPRT